VARIDMAGTLLGSSSMRRVLIVRHGESEWNREQRWQGWIDIDLTERGAAQARQRGAELAAATSAVTAVWCSDLKRARNTAAIIALEMGLGPERPDPGFRERNGGDFQGLTRAEIDARYPGVIAAWHAGDLEAPPNGESDTTILDRFHAALRRAHDTSPDEGDLVVVTHGGSLRIMAESAGIERPTIVANVGGWWFEYDGRRLSGGEPLAALPELETQSAATE
jgi:glucosyl-3-phosphoglycerate phosphatase